MLHVNWFFITFSVACVGPQLCVGRTGAQVQSENWYLFQSTSNNILQK